MHVPRPHVSILFIFNLLIKVARGGEKKHWMEGEEAGAQVLDFNKLGDLMSVTRTLWALISSCAKQG